MDQKIDTADLSKLAMTALGMSMAGNTAKAAGAAQGQFQRLLEQRAKPAGKPAEDVDAGSKPQDTNAADQTAAEDGAGRPEAPDGGPKDTEPAEAKQTPEGEKQAPEEDPLEQAKRLAELGAAFFQPEEGAVWIRGDLETGKFTGVFGSDEYIVAVTEAGQENIPIADLEPQQLEQLQKLVGGLQQLASAEDPEGDAMLEATDPTVEHGPAQLLEKLVDEQTGQVVEQATEEVLTSPREDEDIQVELVDVEQAPEQVFQDVKAPPVKVGETYEAPQTQDVNEQIAAQVLPAVEQGQTRVELQLTPEHLGSVKVEITQNENGGLHIAITAQNSQTRNLLARSADSLQDLLAARSQSPVRVEVQRQEESQPQHNYDGHNSQHQQQEQQQQQHRPRSPQEDQDFLHQLRLGLVDETWGEN